MSITVIKYPWVAAVLFSIVSGCGSAAAPDGELAVEPSPAPPVPGELTRVDVQAIKTQLVFDEKHLLSLAPSAQKILTPLQYDFAQHTIKRSNWLVLNSEWKYSDRPDGKLVRDDLGPASTLTSCATYVDRVEWSTESGLLSDHISPTLCARASIDPAPAWQEVVDKTPTHRDWDKAYGTSKYWSMYDQFVCHFTFAKWKTEWHLEPSRPNVGLAATIWAACNPD